MPSVYLETTIPSYLAAFPSRDLVTAAHQQITHEWWNEARHRFSLVVSEAVVREIAGGDADAAARRQQYVAGLPVLLLSAEVTGLVAEYSQRLGLVGRAQADLLHIAFAVAYRIDYVLTWNCRHIANGEVARKLSEANKTLGRSTPWMVTPEELMGFPGGDDV
jgi:hypothetical protein